MTDQPTGWQAPQTEPGPAPGLAFASPGSRLVAYIVDVVIVGILVVVLALLSVVLIVAVPLLSLLPIVGFIVIPFVYFPYYWARSGQTPGMKMMGIRVVRDRDGGPVTGGQAILRLIGYWVSGFAFYLGYIWIFIDKRKRGWHDLIAGTVVVEAAR
jgi:uncharacterized RDD family membrane protein YckC